MKKFVAIFLLSCIFAGITVSSASAQQQKNTITLEPALVDIELLQDDSEYKTAFTIKNSYNVPVELSVQIQGIDEQNGLFIPNSEIGEQLANTLKLSDSLVTVPENGTAVIYMTIDTPRLPPGGHYATFVITQEKIGSTNVAIKQAISAGLFIVKGGGQLRQVEPGAISYTRNLFGLPKTASVTLKNVGNVHVVPRASVTVYDEDLLMAKGVYNSDSRRILPGRQYQEEVPIVNLARAWLPSRLKIVFEYRADSVEEYKYSETYVWYVPPLFIGVVLAVCIVLVSVTAHLRSRGRKKSSHQHSMITVPQPKTEADVQDEPGTLISVRRVHKKKAPKKITIISEE